MRSFVNESLPTIDESLNLVRERELCAGIFSHVCNDCPEREMNKVEYGLMKKMPTSSFSLSLSQMYDAEFLVIVNLCLSLKQAENRLIDTNGDNHLFLSFSLSVYP